MTLTVVNTNTYTKAPSEEYMNPKQVHHFKEKLVHQKAELTLEIERQDNGVKSSAEKHADPLDQAQQVEDMGFNLHERQRKVNHVKAINQALDRISEEDYGWCEECGDEIGLKRLDINPTASMCIHCQSAQEQKDQHRAA
ncbi:TraR/DksA C4-type zinc finger protein [Neptuniibacter sp. QD37_11]|uniref:TraR/DksA C4-type zinc finger protein n=1 Tax=Neptuniibacter sp. QD37_11 TaxID=3398209 RepID=UPI0039F615E9